MEKALLAICLVTASLCTVAFTNAEKINKLVTNTAKAIKKEILPENKRDKVKRLKASAPVDTTNKLELRIYATNQVGNHTSVTFQNGRFTTRLHKEKGVLYQFNYRKNVLASMQVDGKTISASKISDYRDIIDRLPHENHTEYAEASDVQMDNETQSANKDNHSLFRLDSSKIRLNLQNNKLGSLSKFNDLPGDYDQQRRNYLTDSTSQAYKKMSKSALKAPVAPLFPQANIALKTPVALTIYPKLTNEERDRKMVSELISDHIIKSKDKLSFKISTKEFIVNNKRQPDDIFQKYKAEFVQEISNASGTWAWMYNFDSDAKVEDADAEPYTRQSGLYKKKALDYKSYVSLKDDERRDKMIDELMQDGIIKSKSNLSFKIGTSDFIVNGKKQPDDIYQKYKTHFVKNTTGVWSWTYNYDDAARRESNTIVDEPNQH